MLSYIVNTNLNVINKYIDCEIVTELLSASGPTPLPDDHASSSTPPMQHTSGKSPQVDVSTSRSLKVKSKGIVS